MCRKFIVVILCAGTGAFATAQAQVMCGDVITTSATLTTNLSCSGFDPALTIQGPRGRLNMRGHTLSCQGSGADGIAMSGSGALLQNGTVSNCKDGVVLDGSENQVIKMTLQNNDGNGLHLNSGSNHRITDTTARNNSLDGFCVDPGEDDGSNYFSHDRGMNNGQHGVHTASNFEVLKDTYVNNVMMNNGLEGFLVNSGDLLRQNTARGNGTDGIRVVGSANFLDGNTVQKNFDDGVDVEDVENRLESNKGSGNGSADLEGNGGFDLEDDNADCDNNIWMKNRGTRNQTCIQ